MRQRWGHNQEVNHVTFSLEIFPEIWKVKFFCALREKFLRFKEMFLCYTIKEKNFFDLKVISSVIWFKYYFVKSNKKIYFIQKNYVQIKEIFSSAV